MATLIKRGGVWNVKYYDAQKQQKWVRGYTDKAETVRLAHKLENDKTAILNGHVDPQAEHRKSQRSKPIERHLDDYRAHLQAKGNSANHVSYTIADVKKFVAHSGVTLATAITRQLVDAWCCQCDPQTLILPAR